MAAPQVPFSRPLYGPDDPRISKPGADVVAVKRALSRAGFLSWAQFDKVYNRRTVRAVKAFQGSVEIKPTGHYGFATHEALRLTRRQKSTSEWAFDAYAVWLARTYAGQQEKTREELVRDAIADACAFWIRARNQIAYEQVRPFPVLEPPAILRRTDCSGFVTACFFAGGAPDPNEREFDGFGYTGTLVGNGQLVSLADLQVADLVFYGRTTNASPAFPFGSPTHVAVAIGAGYVASHGSEPGPYKLDADYRPVNQVRRYPLA
jgi:peptidoglycan hydrolase-like protein with peptidoglycan-binding domain